MLLLSFLYPVHAFAEENYLELSVSQEIRTNSPYPKPKDNVRYRLEALDKAPLPEGAEGFYDFTIREENTYKLQFKNLPKGKYHYKLYQLPPSEMSLLTQDSRYYLIQLEVFQSTDGIVIRSFLEDDTHHKPEHLKFVLGVKEETIATIVGGNNISSTIEGNSTVSTIVEKITDLPKTAVEYVFNGLTLAVSLGMLIFILLIIFKKKEKNNKNHKSELDEVLH